MRAVRLLLFLVSLSVTSSAEAQTRNLDLYNGILVGSPELVGMAGAGVALPLGSAGLLLNPATAAARDFSTSSYWGGDAHLAWFIPDSSDANGDGMPDGAEGDFVLGGVLRWGNWGFGIGSEVRMLDVLAPSGNRLDYFSGRVSISLARMFDNEQWVIGGAFVLGNLDVDAGDNTIFSVSQMTLNLGLQFRPRDLDMRFGASFAVPTDKNKDLDTPCVTTGCEGLVLPDAARVPPHGTVGLAMRFGRTPWNRRRNAAWLDERSVVVAADLSVTGDVPNGVGLRSMIVGTPLVSGAEPTVSGRVGVNYEVVPGRLRLLGGTYWQGGRFRNAAGNRIPGRLHGTAGTSIRVLAFDLWGAERRIAVKGAIDLADGYNNWTITAGFW